jgi:hypothetical protein
MATHVYCNMMKTRDQNKKRDTTETVRENRTAPFSVGVKPELL